MLKIFSDTLKEKPESDVSTPTLEEFRGLKVLVTTFFSWTEYEKMLQAHAHIKKLGLLHQNLHLSPFAPAEIKGHMRDINDEMLITLTKEAFAALQLDHPFFHQEWNHSVDYLKESQALLDHIDHFRDIKPQLCALLGPPSELAQVLKVLLQPKKLKPLEIYLLTTMLGRHLQFVMHSYQKLSTTHALEQAQEAFTASQGHPYLPGISSEQDRQLFLNFYQQY